MPQRAAETAPRPPLRNRLRSADDAWTIRRRNSLLSYHKFPDDTRSAPTPPRLIANHARLVRVYMVNHKWKSFTAKLAVNVYMMIVAHKLWVTCDPWYTYFKYLTAWGWTMVQLYFLYTLYLDVISRTRGSENVSEVAKAVAQAISELSFATQVVVTLFFWFCVYPSEPWRHISWEINMHGIGLFLMIFDYLYRFAGFQLRNLSFVYAFAGFYTVLHITTVLCSGEPIYPGLDFRNVYSFVIFLSGLTTIVATHKIFYLLHNWQKLREEWKTVLGISAFFLLPRKKSIDILTAELDEDVVLHESRSPSILEPRSQSWAETLPRKDSGFGSRLKRFAYKEVLSVKPSLRARKVAQRRKSLFSSLQINSNPT